MPLETYTVQARSRERLVAFIAEALRACGCKIAKTPDPTIAPFKFVFDAPDGERMGIVCYAFTSTFTPTKNRPKDEHSFQIKYGSKVPGKLHEIWQDPSGAFTTLFLGVSPDRGYFVGIDPVLNSPTRFYIRFEYKQRHVREIKRRGWYAWTRPVRSPLASGVIPSPSYGDAEQVVVGVTPERFLDYIRFERAVRGLDQGHRGLFSDAAAHGPDELRRLAGDLVPDAPVGEEDFRVDAGLVAELGMSIPELVAMVRKNDRLMMAIRGGVAEWHLQRTLAGVRGVTECQLIRQEGAPDVSLRFEGSPPLVIECKNVLRRMTRGLPTMDFMKTRASPADPCSRYYLRDQFDLVAGCLHPITTRWEFKYVIPSKLDAHPKCGGRLAHRVRIDERWTAAAGEALRAAAALRSRRG
ncbi:hypothetical protein [Anaeromyxobacter sp. SG26]|uniref:hypothetical protein n=1 Tax=Anaeromyxobacter sp. SG26 TaxID=2925407 RepID=UPI001F5764E1|nr:hypothetical protein [Anaeromyxobacter sp. SG26]